jgi:immune inhibitor A
MKRTLWRALVVVALLVNFLTVMPTAANPPAPNDQVTPGGPADPLPKPAAKPVKPLDQPNPKDYLRMRERQQLLEAGETSLASSLALSGTDRVLVILVEFAGTDVFTWTAPITPTDPTTGSQWDPLGRTDPNETVFDVDGNVVYGDCSKIITQTTKFTYGPTLHNQIPRPVSESDPSGDLIWTPDFSANWFNGFMFGNGVTFNYTRTDNSLVNEDFTGKSVKNYYSDLSSGVYTITGDVIGWVQVPHSAWYYGADLCPGARSAGFSAPADYGFPGAGTPQTLVQDALNAVNAISDTIPGFNWANYDKNGDGIIDRLWIVHAGYGEEDNTTLLDRTSYSEAAVWSHSGGLTKPYSVTQNIAASAYIMMPENGGIGVFAHEYGHNLGAIDLYAYGLGETSVGFWALHADDWTGYPIGFEPPAPDPWHLDNWGWLNPMLITDTSKTYEFTVGQASYFNTIPNNSGVYRGAKIQLPNGRAPLAVQPIGNWEWWGGKDDLLNSSMTTKNPTTVPSTGATLVFSTAYGIETEWDFLWVQASTDGGTTWETLTNADTTCTHDPRWIGGQYGFPDDMCGAGLGGFTDYNASFPDYDTETFNLSASTFGGKNVLLRFWYMTDWGTTYEGPFIDNVKIMSGTTALFSDGAESGDANWTYADGWARYDGTQAFTQNYYLQWRNVSSSGGYDSSLGDPRFRFGPVNTGLLVWYNNNLYTDNEIYNYLQDYPSFGPKGRLLVVDSHPDPYRDPNNPYPNSIANVSSRQSMRDAPFSLWDTVDFTMTASSRWNVYTTTAFTGRPAVSEFHDALGYYPGFEYKLRGPSPCTTKQWYDVQWDASAVVPARDYYTTKATGGTYTGQGIRMLGFANPGSTCQAGWYGFWYPPAYDPTGAENTGDPRGTNSQYGWNVKILSQTDMTATVKVWNVAVGKTVGPAPADITAPGTYWFTYTVALENMGSMAAPVNVTMTLPAGLNFVSGGPSGSTMLPPGGTASVDRTFVWSGYSLPADTTVTFTLIATTTVSADDPVKVWTADAYVDDGTNPVTHDTWTTKSSLFTVPGERPATGDSSSKVSTPGSTVLYRVTVTNTSLYNSDTFTVTATTNPTAWTTYLLPAQASLLEATAAPIVIGPVAPGATADVFVLVSIPSTATSGAKATTTLSATSVGDPVKTSSLTLTTSTLFKVYLPVIIR